MQTERGSIKFQLNDPHETNKATFWLLWDHNSPKFSNNLLILYWQKPSASFDFMLQFWSLLRQKSSLMILHSLVLLLQLLSFMLLCQIPAIKAVSVPWKFPLKLSILPKPFTHQLLRQAQTPCALSPQRYPQSRQIPGSFSHLGPAPNPWIMALWPFYQTSSYKGLRPSLWGGDQPSIPACYSTDHYPVNQPDLLSGGVSEQPFYVMESLPLQLLNRNVTCLERDSELRQTCNDDQLAMRKFNAQHSVCDARPAAGVVILIYGKS